MNNGRTAPTDHASAHRGSLGDGARRLEALPVGPLLGFAGGVPVAGAALGVGLAGLVGRGESGLWTGSVAGVAVAIGAVVPLLALRPAKPRAVDRWPMLVFAAQGASVVLTLLTAGVLGWWLLYSPARLDVVVLLGVLPASWVATWIAVAKVLAASLSPPVSAAA